MHRYVQLNINDPCTYNGSNTDSWSDIAYVHGMEFCLNLDSDKIECRKFKTNVHQDQYGHTNYRYMINISNNKILDKMRYDVQIEPKPYIIQTDDYISFQMIKTSVFTIQPDKIERYLIELKHAMAWFKLSVVLISGYKFLL